MNRNHIALLLICIFCFGCSKKKQPAPQNGNTAAIKITLVSGGGQTDSIGRQLPNPIVVKVTQNGEALSNSIVEFQGSGCNEDLPFTFQTGADGTCSYNWSLAGTVGQQTMKVFALDAQNKKLDSVSAVATGLATGPGWHFAACTPFGVPAFSFCKLSSGRLFASIEESGLRYSDDNGMSWNLVKTLGSLTFDYVVSSPTDEVFAFDHANGLYYSSDAGTTWTALTVPPFNTANISAEVCTPSGKLLVTDQSKIYISTDKGKTWTSANTFIPPNGTGGDSGMTNPAEDKNGNLYVIGLESETIYKSSDVGKTWTAVPRPGENDCAFYVDNNNWFYKGRSDPGGGIFISKDNGATYTQLINSPNAFFEYLSVQSDGNFYYDNSALGLYQTAGVSSQVKRIYDNSISTPLPYIVAKNNNIVVLNNGFNLIAYYQK
jgi:photosystem II stability/assembly factor-like uncharacterized protein